MHPMPAVDSLLSRLTIGHMTLGFMAFRQVVLRADRPDPRWRMLSQSELAALERWQESHDAGRLPTERLAHAIEALIGDRAGQKAFAGFNMLGSVICRAPRSALGGLLDLTLNQERNAVELFHRLHAALRGWREQSHQRIRAELRRNEHALAVFVEEDDRRPREREPGRLFARMVEYARLEGAQQAQIAVECALLRTRVQRQHLAARAAFLDMLDDRQRRILDCIETGNSLCRKAALGESSS